MMVVANSFDLWQKDVFFSAAEEVQNSTDIMESVYRTWVRARKEGLELNDSNELRRELQTALGTAKWQLDEFERAIRLSHGYRTEDNTTTRHKQFITAIEDQISRVETALKDSFTEEGNQPLRWVNLDEEERDDLAAFLSGSSSATSQSRKDDSVEMGSGKDAHLHIDDAHEKEIPEFKRKGFKEILTINKDSKYVVELEAKENPGTMDDINCQAERLTGQRRTWSSPNFGAWKIVIADEDGRRKTLESTTELTNKRKGLKSSFRRQKGGEHLPTRGGISSSLDFRGISRLAQLRGWFGGFQRQSQSPRHMKFNSPLQVKDENIFQCGKTFRSKYVRNLFDV
ncbi:Syntaxin 6 [Macleaya cordata]|uniref:Syntaxin 6 n=1 Tax=Macleaya cordata TaxID=56857 RepID=A0A200RDY3_MACCD|nr:Syntaxin 6 [Macleaya cordata]